jgi:predicted RNA-binding Zn-ribbon protein involved in translation (DUF1610 family)
MNFILPAIIFGAVVAFFAKKKLVAKVDTARDVKSGILFAFYTKGNMLLPADRGQVGKLYYDTYITMHGGPLFGEPVAPAGVIIFRVDMPFNTQAHLVGISAKEHAVKLSATAFVDESGLEPVELEGDFNNYFKLYAPADQQIHARYVFDPAAMQFVIDFCANHDWELVYDELYFTISADQDAGPLVAKSLEFIKQIQPAIVREFPTEEALRQKVSYGEYRGNPLACPVCKKEMSYQTYWHECPDGHGRLLHAQKLLGFRIGTIKTTITEPTVAIADRKMHLNCPHCGNEMMPTQYVKRGLMIDSCTKCPYRWLDAGELAKILPKAD